MEKTQVKVTECCAHASQYPFALDYNSKRVGEEFLVEHRGGEILIPKELLFEFMSRLVMTDVVGVNFQEQHRSRQK